MERIDEKPKKGWRTTATMRDESATKLLWYSMGDSPAWSNASTSSGEFVTGTGESLYGALEAAAAGGAVIVGAGPAVARYIKIVSVSSSSGTVVLPTKSLPMAVRRLLGGVMAILCESSSRGARASGLAGSLAVEFDRGRPPLPPLSSELPVLPLRFLPTRLSSTESRLIKE